ncbi:FERM, RhoGEF and pleckstrin domain-containing protein 2-like [Sinocyclocheilus grahami]|uniref:FERM, RhoGEF and pleckstrin domain-containing protein 2-like n=1 Tax=Sinocyclocheilus grahami TaxID=75366 RepID=UPI0007AC921E|nr:PREDICTED: FERM, RhoGEF and pleckstrin domain-containing protein 2-like [Sinocyclocheilus grahami]
MRNAFTVHTVTVDLSVLRSCPQLIVLDAPVEESENEWSVPHCFTIYSAQRTIVVAASSKVEMNKWIEDLNMAIDMSKKCQEKSDLLLDPSLCDRSNRSSDEVSLEQESEDDMNSSRCSLDKQSHHRANTTMHVCWHRNTSVSMSDHSLAVEVAFTHLHTDTHIHLQSSWSLIVKVLTTAAVYK